MKGTLLFLFPWILFLLFSCDYGEGLDSHSNYSPILMTRIQLENSISFHPARDFIRPGKIYTKGQYIFINEKFKGIHVIDNTDPSSPKKLGFIVVPGSIDIAVKESSLYADNATDLVTIDISNINDLKVTDRVVNAFPELIPPDADVVPDNYSSNNRPQNTVIIGWETHINF
jgi:hypothetical protein